MKKKAYPEQVRTALHQAIRSITEDLPACVKRPGKDFSRKRKLSLHTMLLMLVGMGGNSLSKELYDWLGYSSETATTSAFVQQRDKIRPEALKLLFHEFTRLAVPENLLQDYRLLAVDGSDLRLPSNSNDEFSSIRNSEDSKNYNLVHLDAMYDLIGKVYVDASVQPKKGMNEHKALVSMVDQSEISGNVIAIMDRGYESFNNIAHFQEKSWYYIIRAKESYGIISRLSLPDCPEYDEEIMLTLTRRQNKETLPLLKAYPHRYRWIQPHTTFDFIEPKDSKFYDLHFRAVRFAISDGVYETVYTNLNAEDFPPEKIKQFYNLRWGIETSFKELKYAVGLASLHSKKKDFILQEVFARLIQYNYSSIIMHHISISEDLRVNFPVALNICRQFLRELIPADQVLKLIGKHLSPIRPGRQFPRYQNLISAVGFQYRII
mgnify:CR=1 FL=1